MMIRHPAPETADEPLANRLQRARGDGRISLSCRNGAVRLDDLHQSGCAKIFLPRIHSPVPEVVFLNTAGGLTGGDRLAFSLDIGEGAQALATTQTAERAYASTGDAAQLNVTLNVGAGGRLDWLPQETILFDRSRLNRRTVVNLGAGASFLMSEMIVLGRAAMGEVVSDLALSDWREVRRDGRPVLIDPLRLSAASLSRPALFRGARAFAMLALIAPGAEDALEPVRRALPEGMEAAVTAWDGRCIVRMLSDDATALRRAVARMVELMRGGPLPRVWQM